MIPEVGFGGWARNEAEFTSLSESKVSARFDLRWLSTRSRARIGLVSRQFAIHSLIGFKS